MSTNSPAGEGKRVLVTGGAAGIGEQISRALHRDGAEVLVHYGSSRERAEALVAELGGRAHLVQADLSDPDAADALWSTSLELLGGLDVLVNNAGAWIASPLADAGEWDRGWQANLQLNLTAPAALTRAAVQHFREHGGGTVISITSRSAHRGDDGDHLAYGAAKAGLQTLMKGVARAYGRDGVLAYSVAPGWVATDLAAGQVDPDRVRDLPLGEITPPQDVAEVVAFLASGRARHLTGATLDVTGADYVR